MSPRHFAGVCALAAACVSAVLLPEAMAQGDDLKTAYAKYQKGRSMMGPWMAASKDFEKGNKEHQEAVDGYARFVVFGNTYRNRLIPKQDPTAEKLLTLADDAMRNVEKGMTKAFEMPYGADLLVAFEKSLLKGARELLDKNTDQYSRLNGSRALPVIGLGLGSKTRDNKAVMDLKNQIEIAKGLTELTNDIAAKAFAGSPRDDGAALYALRGAREMYESLGTTQPLRTEREKKTGPMALPADLEEKNLSLLSSFVLSTPPYLSGAPSDEVQGYKLLRREAIRALAANRKAKLGAASPALTLARVLTRPRNQANPADAFRLDEQVDAAIGLANTIPNKEFNGELAASLVGHFITEYLAQYGDRANAGEIKAFPFAYHAARLNTALSGWTASPTPGVKLMAQKARACLSSMEKRDSTAQFQEAELIQTLRKDEQLFKGDAASKIEFPAN